VFDALFAAAGSTVPGTSITGIGVYPAWWWWRNTNNAQCWHGSFDSPDNIYVPECDLYPNYYHTAPAWTH
jgi:hypothetical protein